MKIKNKYKIYGFILLITLFFMFFGNRNINDIKINNKKNDNINDNYNDEDEDDLILPNDIPMEKLFILYNNAIKKNNIENNKDDIMNYNNNNSVQINCFIVIIILISSLYLFLYINERKKIIEKQEIELKQMKDGYILLDDKNYI